MNAPQQKIEDPMVVKLNQVILSYPHVFEPYSGGVGDDGKPQKAKYSATFLLDKKTQEVLIKMVKDKIRAAAAIGWPLEPGKKQFMPPSDKLCLRDGSQSNREETEDFWILKASEDIKPYVVDQARRPLASEDDKMYPGAVVNAVVRLWAQSNKFGKRINANLVGVQFVRDGERLAGRPTVPVEDAFDMVDGAELDGDEFSGSSGSSTASDDPFA